MCMECAKLSRRYFPRGASRLLIARKRRSCQVTLSGQRTKHRKAAQDAKRSALFSKLSRNITVAAKEGGDPNPDNNASLAAAIEKAKGYSLPKDKIKTAIDKAFGTGKDAANYETLTYEGYGPAGVAIYCEALTDNRNRTAADVGAAFRHANGSLGTPGCVGFQFERKGQIMVEKIIPSTEKKVADKQNAVDEDEFMLAVAEAGGSDYEDAGDEWIVYTAPNDLMAVKNALEAQDIEVKGAELTMIPTTPTEVDPKDAAKVMRLVDKLEELEDLQNVYHSMDMTDEVIAALEQEELGFKAHSSSPKGVARYAIARPARKSGPFCVFGSCCGRKRATGAVDAWCLRYFTLVRRPW